MQISDDEIEVRLEKQLKIGLFDMPFKEGVTEWHCLNHIRNLRARLKQTEVERDEAWNEVVKTSLEKIKSRSDIYQSNLESSGPLMVDNFHFALGVCRYVFADISALKREVKP